MSKILFAREFFSIESLHDNKMFFVQFHFYRTECWKMLNFWYNDHLRPIFLKSYGIYIQVLFNSGNQNSVTIWVKL